MASLTPTWHPRVDERESLGSREPSTVIPSSHEDADRNPDKPIKSLSSKINDYWIWEILSCILSLVALAAIVVVQE